MKGFLVPMWNLKVTFFTHALLCSEEATSHDWQRFNIYKTHVTWQEKFCNLIIEGESIENVVSRELIEKLNLKTEHKEHQYQLAWLNEHGCVKHQCLVSFSIGNIYNELLCDVNSISAAYILLEGPWLYSHNIQHDVQPNIYRFIYKSRSSLFNLLL